ncbi:MAG: long-chain fatty acid--CoA ligase [Bacteroidales bacterium]|nr:long-chain fatty acid--CoA ligase [Bacteroidales bacterium]
MRIKRLFDLLPYLIERHDKSVIFGGKKSGKWVSYSTRDYVKYSNLVSYGLMHLGIVKGDKVMTISNNRPEWNFVDMGCLQTGAVHVPVYPTINDEDLLYVIKEVEPKFIFASSKFLYQKVCLVLEQSGINSTVFVFDEMHGATHYQELIKKGEENPDEKSLEILKSAVGENDIASIIYTSGTTSVPKGVMLTHENHISNFLAAAFTIRLKPEYVYLNYLPLSHSYERMVNYIVQYLGMSQYYAESVSNILANMKDIKPHVLVTVPLLLEKVYEGIYKKGMSMTGIKRIIFKWAMNLAGRYRLNTEFSWWYRFQMDIAYKLVFIKWREAMGGNMIKIIAGGAKLQPHLLNIFWAARIPVFEGYGLTEAAPLVAYNTEDAVKPGSVGTVIADVVVKIAPDGEVLVKGPNVMPGYYKHPEWTAEIIDKDGWLSTGDLGELDEKGFLTITGRKKDIFKIASGVYVFPERLEARLKQSFAVTHALVSGENKNYLSAIIVPSLDYLQEYCKQNKLEPSTLEVMLKYKEVKTHLASEISIINGPAVKEAETIQRYSYVPDEWTIENGDLTPSMKIKRRQLMVRYQKIFDSFYT